jgi:hypothetical protein
MAKHMGDTKQKVWALEGMVILQHDATPCKHEGMISFDGHMVSEQTTITQYEGDVKIMIVL